MFQFPACPPVRLWIHLTVTGSSPAGFPHSEICVSKPTCGYTQLIAACRVLHRRMVPGHPPCALCSLIFSSLDPETNCFSYLYVSVVATGLIESLIFLVVQLSRCSPGQTLKTIQNTRFHSLTVFRFKRLAFLCFDE